MAKLSKVCNLAMSKPSSWPETGSKVDAVSPNDVILGRGGFCNKWRGNITFRRIIWKFQDEYFTAPMTRKRQVAAKALKQFAAMTPPGRFVERLPKKTKTKKKTKATTATTSSKYVFVSWERAIERACQGLRERRNVHSSFEEAIKPNKLEKTGKKLKVVKACASRRNKIQAKKEQQSQKQEHQRKNQQQQQPEEEQDQIQQLLRLQQPQQHQQHQQEEQQQTQTRQSKRQANRAARNLIREIAADAFIEDNDVSDEEQRGVLIPKGTTEQLSQQQAASGESNHDAEATIRPVTPSSNDGIASVPGAKTGSNEPAPPVRVSSNLHLQLYEGNETKEMVFDRTATQPSSNEAPMLLNETANNPTIIQSSSQEEEHSHETYSLLAGVSMSSSNEELVNAVFGGTASTSIFDVDTSSCCCDMMEIDEIEMPGPMANLCSTDGFNHYDLLDWDEVKCDLTLKDDFVDDCHRETTWMPIPLLS